MRLRSKRLVSLLLAGSMMVSMVPASAVTAFAAEAKSIAVMATDGEIKTSGTCGATENDNVSWNYDSGVLTISGTGAMANFTKVDGVNNRPWEAYADQITEVKIASTITTIGESAFQKLTALKKVNIPAAITDFGTYTFNGDSALEEVIWDDPENFNAPVITDSESTDTTHTGRYVPNGMFNKCTSLGNGKELSTWLPKSFEGICTAAFRGTKFTVDFDKLNNRMNYYGAYAFDEMENLDSFTLTDDITLGLIGGTASKTFMNSGLKSLTIKAKNVPDNFASNCTKLQTLTLENTVQKIGYSAFSNTGITELTVPETNGKLTIGKTAFMNNSQLKKLTLQGNMSLDESAFAGCGIEDFTVAEGAEVEYLANPFAAYNSDSTPASAVTSIKNVEIMGTLKATPNLYVTDSMENARKMWTELFSGSNISDVTVSGANLQYFKKSTFPSMKTLKVVGGNAEGAEYAYNNAGESDTIVSPLESVYMDVDTYCSNTGAFIGATNLKTLTIKANTVKFGSYDFQSCPALKVIDLSQCETVEYNSNNSTQDSFASDTANLPADVRIYVKNETSNPHSHESGLNANYGTVFVTNGGVVDPTKDGFDTVTKAGYKAVWYDGENVTTDTVPQAGHTYTVKWADYDTKVDTDVKVNTDSADKTVEITVDVKADPTELNGATATLNFTDANGNDDSANVAEVKVNGTKLNKDSNGKYIANIADLMGTNVSTVATYAATVNGSATLTVTYKTAGTHNIGIVLNAANGDVICKQTATVKIAPEPGTLTLTACTAKLEDGTEVKNGDKVPVGAEVTVVFDKDFYADSNLVLSGWQATPNTLTDTNGKLVKDITADSFTFVMPEAENGVTIEALTKTADTEDDSWDAATVVTGVAIGAGAAVLTYHIGTELYAEQVLGKGVAVPKTRADVALKAWELAGKPAVELNGEPLSETAQAEKWAVESGLMQNDAEGNFNGAKKMNKLKALRVLDKAQKLG